MKNWRTLTLMTSLAVLSYLALHTPAWAESQAASEAANEASSEASSEAASEAASESGGFPAVAPWYWAPLFRQQPLATPLPPAPQPLVVPEIREWNGYGYARVIPRRHGPSYIYERPGLKTRHNH